MQELYLLISLKLPANFMKGNEITKPKRDNIISNIIGVNSLRLGRTTYFIGIYGAFFHFINTMLCNKF